jgi:vacuolar-type H+-ATPase subunit H
MNCISAIMLILKEAKQGDRQLIREFTNYLEELEEDILEMSYKESCI